MNGKAIRVKFKKNGKNKHVIRKVITEQTIVAAYDLANVEQALLNGCEVRIGSAKSGIRLFPCLDKKLEKMEVVAQTFGAFRNILDNAKWEVADESTLSLEVAKQRNKAAAKCLVEAKKVYRACVTPDKVVVCPNCGTEIRVGKVLSEIK